MEFALTRKQLNKKRAAGSVAPADVAATPDPDQGTYWSNESPPTAPLLPPQARSWTTRGQDGDDGSFFSAGSGSRPDVVEPAFPSAETRLPPPVPTPPLPVRTVGLDQLLDDLQGRSVTRGSDLATAPAGEAYGVAVPPTYGTAAPLVPQRAAPEPAGVATNTAPISGSGTPVAAPAGSSAAGARGVRERSNPGRHRRTHGRSEVPGSRTDVLVRRYLGAALFVAAAILLIVFLPSERHAAPSPSGMGPAASQTANETANHGATGVTSPVPVPVAVPVSGAIWFVGKPASTWASTSVGPVVPV